MEDLPPQRSEIGARRSPQAALSNSVLFTAVQLPASAQGLSLQSFLSQVDEGGRTPLSFHHFFAAEDQDNLQGDAVIRLSALPKYGCIENTGTGTMGALL